jgi:hypothetical protein
VKREDSTRGRSFLFFALGVVAGIGLKRAFTLRVPENGLIAVNVPLDALRLGSLSTRTTHPFYIGRWNQLLSQLDISGKIDNPYWNRTKGEMVAACANQALLKELAPRSLSCAAPTKARWQKHGTEHCGYCLPCLIRRASVEYAWGKGGDKTTYTRANLEAQPLNTLRAEGLQVRSFQYAIARLQAKPGLEKLLIHKPGSLADNPSRVEELAAVYRRGMLEVAALLKNVRTIPS